MFEYRIFYFVETFQNNKTQNKIKREEKKWGWNKAILYAMNGLRVRTALLQKGTLSFVVEANLLSKVMKNDNANLLQTQFPTPFRVGSIQNHNSTLRTMLTKLTSRMIHTMGLLCVFFFILKNIFIGILKLH